MSKKELLKWKNKFRLWCVLHDEVSVDRTLRNQCKKCPNYYIIENSANCKLQRYQRLAINDEMDKIIKRQKGNITIADGHCIEWIKYV